MKTCKMNFFNPLLSVKIPSPTSAMANENTISMFKRMDEQMNESLQFIVPVTRDAAGLEAGPASYRHTAEPPIWEKTEYTKLLTGNDVTPTVSITQEDIDALKEKSYRSVERDFNNYVGAMLKPNENPANKAFLHKIYPGWFEKQKQAVENWHDSKKKMESLLLLGPRNEEDLFTLYRLGYGMDATEGRMKIGAKDNLGVFRPLIDQLNGPSPGLNTGWGTPDDVEYAFQRGIFNTDRRQLTSQAIMGKRGSVWESGSSRQDGGGAPIANAAIKARLANPVTGEGYPFPQWRPSPV
jgi:hypothetical protein